MKVKDIIGVLLTLGGLIGLVVCAVCACAFYFQNPDMTGLRRLIEYPAPTIGAVVCWVITMIGTHLINRR